MNLIIPKDPAIWLRDLLAGANLGNVASSVISAASLIIIVLIVSWLSNQLAKTVILRIIARIVRLTESKWDDIFLEQKVFTRLSHLAPALVIWSMAGWALKAYPLWLLIVQRFSYVYILVVLIIVINSFIEAWHKIYLTLPVSRHRHIKGYVQIVKIIVVILFGLIIVSVIFSKEVTTIIAGLGVMASVIMLIFKDAILGLVASIQLSANDMVKVGDWITMPARDVDGEVMDITLTTVKVRNFDKTIITVPVYALVNESFQNWKGMVETGVRRILRIFFIDTKSVGFAAEDLILKVTQADPVSSVFYFEDYSGEIYITNRLNGVRQYFCTGKLTNLGLFRIYAEAYMRSHPMIDKVQNVILRHREPTGSGTPVQILAYTSRTDFATYENIQSEVLEHLIAKVVDFKLRIYQEPTGNELIDAFKTK